MADSERGETCPDCGTRVPVDPGFTAWCDCGWNIAPGERSASPTRIEAIYGRMGERFGRSLFEEVLERGAARPGRSATRLLLLAVSAAVLATPVATAVGAVLLACSFPGNVFAWGAAVVLALLTWVVRPRPGRVPREWVTTPKSHPQLQTLVRRVAKAIGTEPPEIVALSSDFGAFAARTGLRQRKTVVLGVPMLVALDAQESVAVVAHEVAHFANGDVARSVLASNAVCTLGAWCDVVAPDAYDAQRGWAQTAAAGMMWLASWIPRSLLTFLAHLYWRDSQRAEYYADRLGAEVAGSEAFIRLLEGFLAGPRLLEHACHRVIVTRAASSVLGEFRALLSSLPHREVDRMRRRAAAEPTSLDATHPPTGMRIRGLRERPSKVPRVALDAGSHAALLDELRPQVERADRDLATAHESSLYSG